MPTGVRQMDVAKREGHSGNAISRGQRTQKENDSTTAHFLAELPDKVLYEIMRYANIGIGLKLRVDKRMEQRIHDLLASETIYLTIFPDYYWFSLCGGRAFAKNDYEGVTTLVKALRRWSTNTTPRRIQITVQDAIDDVNVCGYKNIGSAIYALCQFNTDKLIIYTKADTNSYGSKYYQPPLICLPQLDFPTLLDMIANVREVSIDLFCSSLTGNDLNIFWKALTEGDSNLEFLSLLVTVEVCNDFIHSCFGIIIESSFTEDGKTIVFKNGPNSKINPAKLYSDRVEYPNSLIQFTGCFMTKLKQKCIGANYISFEKLSAGQRYNLLKKLFEIKLNHAYKTKTDY